MASVEEEKQSYVNELSSGKAKEKQCPQFLNIMNATELDNNGHKLKLPCGLTQGSSITVISIPDGLSGNFQIDLTGEALPEEPDAPIIMHYNVRLHGDKITEDPVIVQNTWTTAHDWGDEERCPSPTPEKNRKVDGLDQCNNMVARNYTRMPGADSEGSRRSPVGLKENSNLVSFQARSSICCNA